MGGGGPFDTNGGGHYGGGGPAGSPRRIDANDLLARLDAIEQHQAAFLEAMETSYKHSVTVFDALVAMFEELDRKLDLLAGGEAVIIRKENQMADQIAAARKAAWDNLVAAVAESDKVIDAAVKAFQGLEDRIAALVTPRTDPDTTDQINKLLADVADNKAKLATAVAAGTAAADEVPPEPVPAPPVASKPFDGVTGTPEQNASFADGKQARLDGVLPTELTDAEKADQAFSDGYYSIPAPEPVPVDPGTPTPATGGGAGGNPAVVFDGSNGTDAENAEFALGVADAKAGVPKASVSPAYDAGFASVVPVPANPASAPASISGGEAQGSVDSASGSTDGGAAA